MSNNDKFIFNKVVQLPKKGTFIENRRKKEKFYKKGKQGKNCAV